MNNYIDTAKEIRKLVLEMGHAAGRKAIHFGPALSIADFLGVLYGGYMHLNPQNFSDPDRDRFILSKGHAYAALYAALCLKGFFTKEDLIDNFMTDGGFLPAHPVKCIEKGIECSSGSLGMSLSFALGKALALRKKGSSARVFTVLGDGECNEGSVWEAFMCASALNASNLVAFIDVNGLQHDDPTSDVIPLDITNMVRACGWEVAEIDGNDIGSIVKVLDKHFVNPIKPFAIIGKTVKGKGVSFMENDNSWHHASIKEDLFNKAMEELL